MGVVKVSWRLGPISISLNLSPAPCRVSPPSSFKLQTLALFLACFEDLDLVWTFSRRRGSRYGIFPRIAERRINGSQSLSHTPPLVNPIDTGRTAGETTCR